MNLSKAGKVSRVMNAQAAGTGTTNGTGVDNRGFQGVTFYALIGVIDAAGTVDVKAQESDDNSTWSDLEGSNIAFAADDDNKVAVLEIAKPRKRYARPVVVRTGGTTTTIDGVLAVQTTAAGEPVTHDSTVKASELHHAPAAGTA